MRYPIAEYFVSINGEGQRAGELALFLRFPGCNLACTYCDTMWVNEKDFTAKTLEKEEIIALAVQAGVKNITVTGGEPLLQPGIAELLAELSRLPNRMVEVETNGSVDLTPFLQAAPQVSFTVDYKLPYSGMESKMCLDNLRQLRPVDTLKLVCGTKEDLEVAAEILEKYALPGRVPIYFSPVFGKIEAQEMVAFLKERRLNEVRLQLQLHKYIWPPEARGV